MCSGMVNPLVTPVVLLLHEPHKPCGKLMCSRMVNPLVTPVVLLLHEHHTT
jgi:hypothetical protein